MILFWSFRSVSQWYHSRVKCFAAEEPVMKVGTCEMLWHKFELSLPRLTASMDQWLIYSMLPDPPGEYHHRCVCVCVCVCVSGSMYVCVWLSSRICGNAITLSASHFHPQFSPRDAIRSIYGDMITNMQFSTRHETCLSQRMSSFLSGFCYFYILILKAPRDAVISE